MDVFREKKEWILVWPFQFFLFVCFFNLGGERGECKKKKKIKREKKDCAIFGLGK